MSQVRFQVDWNLNHIIVQAAQRREPTLDFQTAHAAGLLGVNDYDVLAHAARAGRLLVTHDFYTICPSILPPISRHRPARVFCWYRSVYPSRQLWRTSS